MFDAVFERRAIALSGVAPVMFGDEFGFRSGDERLRRPCDSCREFAPTPRPFPRVTHRALIRIGCGRKLDLAPHRQRDVLLVVSPARDECDRRTRHNLFDEDHPASQFVARMMPHIEPQVDLIEVRVKWNAKPKYARVEEPKPDEAHERATVPEVEFRPMRHTARQQRRIDFIVQHHQMPPLGREERAGGSGQGIRRHELALL